MGKLKIIVTLLVILIASTLPVSAEDYNVDKFKIGRFTQPRSQSDSVQKFEITDEFERIAENQKLTLYLKKETLAIRILNKETGYIWSSNLDSYEDEKLNERWRQFFESGVVIEYTPTARNQELKINEESIQTNENTKVSIKNVKNGFEASVKFAESSIELSYSVTLDKDGLDIQLKHESIKELKTNQLVSVMLYPMLGSTKAKQQDGYFFVPDGDGALCGFENYYQSVNVNYSKAYYGNDVGITNWVQSQANMPDQEQLKYPIFGIVHGIKNNGFLVNTIEGANYARLQVYPAGVRTDFYFIANKFMYRQEYTHMLTTTKKTTLITGDMSTFDIHEKITLLSNQKADYVGMAKIYRSYLESKKQLIKNVEETDAIPLDLEVFGGDAMTGVMSNSSIVMTTVDQTKAIVEDLNSDDIKQINLRYANISKSAVSGGANDRTTLNSAISSTSDFKSLQDFSKKHGALLSTNLYYDFILGEPSCLNQSDDFIKGYNKVYLYYPYSFGAISSSYFGLNARGFEKLLAEEIKNTKDNNFNNVVIGTPMLVSSFNDEGITRDQAETRIKKALSNANKEMSHIYTWQYNLLPSYFSEIRGVMGLSMSTSLYPYVTDTVPFSAIVTRGYMDLYTDSLNFDGNPSESLLRMIEWGIYPSYLVTWEETSQLQYSQAWWNSSSKYADWQSEIKDTYHKVNDALKYVIGETIEDHQYIDYGVAKTTYSNGVVIIVNYTKQPIEFQGKVVSGESCEVFVS